MTEPPTPSLLAPLQEILADEAKTPGQKALAILDLAAEVDAQTRGESTALPSMHATASTLALLEVARTLTDPATGLSVAAVAAWAARP